MINQDKIKEIREALDAATPGPWEPVNVGMPSGAVWRVDCRTHCIATAISETNAHLIANAPEWLRFLISEIGRLQENNDKLMTWAKMALIGAKHEACKYTEDDPDTTWHCCNWSEVVEEAERIGVTVE